MLTPLFTLINKEGNNPVSWKTSLVAPIYKKKNDKTDPNNYRLIYLLAVMSKLYASLLQRKLMRWTDIKKVLGGEEAGFRKGHSCIDHCFTLASLISLPISLWPSLLNTPGILYPAFIYLKAAFDCDSCAAHVWNKLNAMWLPTRLLELTMNPNSLCIKLNNEESISSFIPVHRGVQHGWVLAPHLFNVYQNDVPPGLQNISTQTPAICWQPCYAL